MQIDSLIARGVISPGAAERLYQNIAQVPRDLSQQPHIGPEMGRGGGRAGASGEKVIAPDYGAQAQAKTPYGYWREGGEGRRELQRLNDEGKTLKEIADIFDVDKTMIIKVMKREGIELKNPQRGGYSTYTDDTLREMQARGLSQADMARELGVRPHTISWRMKAMRLRENPESAEGMGTEPTVSDWETLPDGTMVRSSR